MPSQTTIPVWNLPDPMEWGGIDLPLLGLSVDWHGNPLSPAAAFSLATDPSHFWFLAHHTSPARLFPSAQAGSFSAGLWDYDVAECFIAKPDDSYFELNLAPNAAWWACEFSSPRNPISRRPLPIPGVRTYSEIAPDGAWLAAMAIPLEALAPIGLDWSQLKLNVCLILGGQQRIHLSAAKLPGSLPDFHQPSHFARCCQTQPPPA